MNSIQVNTNLKNDLFHYLTGSFFQGNQNKYFFSLYDSENDISSHYETDNYILVADPSVDSIFQILFLYNKERLQSFLNAVFFEPNGNKITNLEYIIGDHYDIGRRYNLDNLEADIACKAKIKGFNKVLIDIEIQLNFLAELEDTFFKYDTGLGNANCKFEVKELKKKTKTKKVKRIFNDIIIMGFTIPQDAYNKKNTIKLMTEQVNSNNQNTLPAFKIYEIKVGEILNKLKNEKNVKLFGKDISKDGEDWLKLIGLRFWATKEKGNIGRYILPKINENEFYSQNSFINQTILDILEGGDLEMNLFSQFKEEFAKSYLEGKKEGEKKFEEEGIKKNQLITVYNFLKLKKYEDIDYLPLDCKYKENEVYEILNETGSIRLDIIQLLFKHLQNRNCLE